MKFGQIIPESVKRRLRPAYHTAQLRLSCRLGGFPASTDLVGYETLLRFIHDHGCGRLPGDFIEIGAFLGGGTRKLAGLARALGKQVWVIDIFDPTFDLTANTSGRRMSQIYRSALHGQSQEAIFRAVTKPFSSTIRTIKDDSSKVSLAAGVQFCFGFIDGNHDPSYVKNDFRLVWSRLVPGGWAGFHDYGGDLPQVTGAVDSLLDLFRDEIESVARVPEKTLLFAQKKIRPAAGR